MEKSFDKIQLTEAAKMLSIPDANTMKEYGKKVRYTCFWPRIHSLPTFTILQRDWSLKADYYAFNIDVKKTDDSLNALELAKQAVDYARELEMIV